MTFIVDAICYAASLCLITFCCICLTFTPKHSTRVRERLSDAVTSSNRA